MKRRRLSIIALFMFAAVISLLAPQTAPAKAVSLSWGKPGYFAVNDYCYIKWRVNAPSTVTWKGAQGNVYDKKGNRIGVCHENFTIKSKYLDIDYNVKRQMKNPKTGKKVILKPGTVYYFMFQAKTGGKWYNSKKVKFKPTTVAQRATKFTHDARWKNNITWGPEQRPKYNTKYDSYGCCAYAADFRKYMYGISDMTAQKKKFTKPSSIKPGDIIHLKNGYGHWFVVLNKKVDPKNKKIIKLATAEGSAFNKGTKKSNAVYVTYSKYYLKGGKLYGCGYQDIKGDEDLPDGRYYLKWDFGYRYYW